MKTDRELRRFTGRTLYDKAATLITKGQLVSGWVRFETPGYLFNELGTKIPTLTISFADFQENLYHVIFIAGEDASTSPRVYPGITPP